MSKRIDKYILEEKLNKGGYAICYRARDEKDNKYAIKIIEKSNEKNIINEINMLKIMKSRYSVEFIEYIENDNYYFIVMELCDGDLNYLLEKKGSLDIITIIKITIQLNEVLKLMHKKKIEHRDLKPENILIKFKNEDDIDIKLTDYGLSKSYQSNSKYSNNAIGTMFYSPPEVYEDQGNSKSDLWSIGIILYYLYFKKLPFIISDFFN